MPLTDRINQAVAAIEPRLRATEHAEGVRYATPTPPIALILGSGLGGLAGCIDVQLSLDYGDIPHFRQSGAPGHAGRLLFGKLAGQRVMCMQGRLHPYEGHSAEDIVFPLQVMCALGARSLLVTNAAGGVNTGFDVGDVMLICDHINFTGANPLTIGTEQALHAFTDMSYAYTPALRAKALAAAQTCGLALRQGVYLGVRGPAFETPAEIRAFRTLGADAVGMSTVFEVIAAASLGMEILGLSLITNMAAGVLDQPITGEEVLEASKQAAANLESLVLEVLRGW
jgi:purine-nucleoside phosphorylase